MTDRDGLPILNDDYFVEQRADQGVVDGGSPRRTVGTNGSSNNVESVASESDTTDGVAAFLTISLGLWAAVVLNSRFRFARRESPVPDGMIRDTPSG